MSFPHPKTIVIDIGYFTIKAGYAGASSPTIVVPTLEACRLPQQSTSPSPTDGPPLPHPMVPNGAISNWQSMQHIYHTIFHHYLNINPADYTIIAIEPPLVSPENRKHLCSLLFTTFQVSSLFVASSAMTSLYASFAAALRTGNPTAQTLTGLVVDCGHSGIKIVPVIDSLVLHHAVTLLPFGGREVTATLIQYLKQRGVYLDNEEDEEKAGEGGSITTAITATNNSTNIQSIATKIKEEYCYVCSDPMKEGMKYIADPAKYHKTLNDSSSASTGSVVVLETELFLAPEIIFSPQGWCIETNGGELLPSLPEAIATTINTCPIDERRNLYSNIVLNGGTTLLPNFNLRLQRDVKRHIDAKMTTMMMTNSSSSIVTGNNNDNGDGAANDVINTSLHIPTSTSSSILHEMDVRVHKHKMQGHAAWSGASLLAVSPGFDNVVTRREEYTQHGWSVVYKSKPLAGL